MEGVRSMDGLGSWQYLTNNASAFDGMCMNHEVVSVSDLDNPAPLNQLPKALVEQRRDSVGPLTLDQHRRHLQ